VAEAALLDELLANSLTLQFRGPSGTVLLADDETSPLLLVAAGTGAAQALGIIDDVDLRALQLPVHLLACAEAPAEFLDDESFTPDWLCVTRINDPRRDADNQALIWLRKNAIRYRAHRIILSGNPAFVYAVQDVLTAAHIDPGQTESDVYTYAPRA
jgi:CDP-4-dehydro-6-deoxyglucose reductase